MTLSVKPGDRVTPMNMSKELFTIVLALATVNCQSIVAKPRHHSATPTLYDWRNFAMSREEGSPKCLRYSRLNCEALS